MIDEAQPDPLPEKTEIHPDTPKLSSSWCPSSSSVPPAAPATPSDPPEKTINGENNSSKNYKIISTPQDTSLVPTLAVTLWLGWNGILVALSLYFLFFASGRERLIILGVCTASLVLPAEFPWRWGERVGDWMMLGAEKYFGLTTIIENEENLLSHANAINPNCQTQTTKKALIFAFEPHDILPYAVFAFSPALKRLPGKIGRDGCCLITSAVFGVPFLRQVYRWVKTYPVDRGTFLGKLRRGESFAFVPGGVQEVIHLESANSNVCNDETSNEKTSKNTNDDADETNANSRQKNNEKHLTLYLLKRKGFVKHALATGSPIVPVFAFHLDGSYGYYIPRSKIVHRISRAVGVVPLVFWGRFGIPFGIPYPKRIVVVIGEAIDVESEGSGDDDDDDGGVSEERVDRVHKLFLRELEALFERHKVEAGYGGRKLRIV